MKQAAILSSFILTALFPLSAEVPLRIIDGRPVVEQVYLNGSGPYRFLLDTGAQSNQFDVKLASQLGLRPSFRVELATANGSTFAPGLRGVELAVGDRKAADMEVLLTDLAGVRRLSSGIDGVLGQDFLSHFDYRLDFRLRRIFFETAPPESPKSVTLAFTRSNGCPMVETSLGRLVLDSGANQLVLFRASAGNNGAYSVTTAAGISSFAAATSTPALLIAGRRFSAGEAAVLPPSPSRREDGLLPVHLFRSIHVSNSTGRLTLQ